MYRVCVCVRACVRVYVILCVRVYVGIVTTSMIYIPGELVHVVPLLSTFDDFSSSRDT